MATSKISNQKRKEIETLIYKTFDAVDKTNKF